VTIAVVPVLVPTAVADAFATSISTPLGVGAPGVRANDTNQDASRVVAQFVSRSEIPAAMLMSLFPGLTAAQSTSILRAPCPPFGGLSLFCGVVGLTGSGGFTYTPPGAFSGVDYFFYRLVSGGPAASNVAAVKITVGTPPVGIDDVFSAGVSVANNPQSLVVGAPGVLRNDLNTVARGGGPIPFGTLAVLLTQPTFGTLTFSENGSFRYTPNSRFIGTDSFTYVPVTGGTGTTGDLAGTPTTVYINVR
jgi:hypothetical protein